MYQLLLIIRLRNGFQDAFLSALITRVRKLEHIINVLFVKAQPDFCNGAGKQYIHAIVQDDLRRLIIPTDNYNNPMAVNLFLKLKAQDGCSPTVAQKQARFDGAHGACNAQMQNYKVKKRTMVMRMSLAWPIST